MNTKTLDLSDDVIDVRDIIARFEVLEADSHTWCDEGDDADAWHELNTLQAILDDLKGDGGDEEWRGDWYPVTLIADWYFTAYAMELIFDCGDLPTALPNYIEIDWDATARNVRMDYSSTNIDGSTYWYR